MILGDPEGKGRPKFGNGRVYTPRRTELAEGEIRRAWEERGAPRLDGPLSVRVTLIVERPRGHYRADGVTLSAEGLRHPLPDTRKPDVDNALKLVLDALNKRAWTDDVRVVEAYVRRCWGPRARTEIEVRTIGVEGIGR
jgi:Holliday junction resolvase RusA-like endonuclease